MIDKILSWKAKRDFLANVIYKGDINRLKILHGAHARPFRGSKKEDIVIGDAFLFQSGTLVSQNGGKIRIGDHVIIGFNCVIGASNSITIGDYALFADNITVMDNNNHPVNPKDRQNMLRSPLGSDYRGWKYSISEPVKIGRNVWCGANVRICKGVTIGDGAVIAANTVVVKDVPPNSICAGNPGKIVKMDIEKIPRLISDEEF